MEEQQLIAPGNELVPLDALRPYSVVEERVRDRIASRRSFDGSDYFGSVGYDKDTGIVTLYGNEIAQVSVTPSRFSTYATSVLTEWINLQGVDGKVTALTISRIRHILGIPVVKKAGKIYLQVKIKHGFKYLEINPTGRIDLAELGSYRPKAKEVWKLWYQVEHLPWKRD